MAAALWSLFANPPSGSSFGEQPFARRWPAPGLLKGEIASQPSTDFKSELRAFNSSEGLQQNFLGNVADVPAALHR